MIQLHSWRYILLISQNYFSLVLYLILISSTFPSYICVYSYTVSDPIFWENDVNVYVTLCVSTEIPACSSLLFNLERLNFSQYKGIEILLALTSIRASQNKRPLRVSVFSISDSKSSSSQDLSPTSPCVEQGPFLSSELSGPKSDFLGREDSFRLPRVTEALASVTLILPDPLPDLVCWSITLTW